MSSHSNLLWKKANLWWTNWPRNLITEQWGKYISVHRIDDNNKVYLLQWIIMRQEHWFINLQAIPNDAPSEWIKKKWIPCTIFVACQAKRKDQTKTNEEDKEIPANSSAISNHNYTQKVVNGTTILLITSANTNQYIDIVFPNFQWHTHHHHAVEPANAVLFFYFLRYAFEAIGIGNNSNSFIVESLFRTSYGTSLESIATAAVKRMRLSHFTSVKWTWRKINSFFISLHSEPK